MGPNQYTGLFIIMIKTATFWALKIFQSEGFTCALILKQICLDLSHQTSDAVLLI